MGKRSICYFLRLCLCRFISPLTFSLFRLLPVCKEKRTFHSLFLSLALYQRPIVLIFSCVRQRCFFFHKEKERQSVRQGRQIHYYLTKLLSARQAHTLALWNFTASCRRERRERFQIFGTQRQGEKERQRTCTRAHEEKKRENKESYKCSFFKHFIVVTVVVLSTAYEQQSCLAPCRRVTRNQFLFEEAHIKHIHLIPTWQSSRHFSLSLSVCLFCCFSIRTVSEFE